MYCFSVQLKDKGPHMWFPDLTFLKNILSINCWNVVSFGIWNNKQATPNCIYQTEVLTQVDSVLKIHSRLATRCQEYFLSHSFRNVQNGPKSDTKLEKHQYTYQRLKVNSANSVLSKQMCCVQLNLSLEIISGESPPTVWINASTRIYC